MEGNEAAGDAPAQQDAPRTTFVNGDPADAVAEQLPRAAVTGADPAAMSAEEQAALSRGRQAIADDSAKVGYAAPPQRPSMGRIVIYVIPDQDGQPAARCPAVVTRAHNNRCVNLHLMPDADDLAIVHQTCGLMPTSVELAEVEPNVQLTARSWHWPPRV